MLNHEPLRLADGEYRFACLVWDNEPLPSGQLVTLAAAALGWTKSTTYTVLKKLLPARSTAKFRRSGDKPDPAGGCPTGRECRRGGQDLRRQPAALCGRLPQLKADQRGRGCRDPRSAGRRPTKGGVVMRSIVLSFLLLSARGAVAAAAVWCVCRRCAAPTPPAVCCAGCGWP